MNRQRKGFKNNKQKSNKQIQNYPSVFKKQTHTKLTTTQSLPNQPKPTNTKFTYKPTQKMSSHQQQQTQIMQTCQRINQMLQIPHQQFSLQALTHIDWYMTVLEMIYPQLGERFQQIKRIQNEGTAMDKLLFMLTEEEIIEEDFLEIKGQDIIEGDIESVYYVVQLLNALIERQAEEEQNEGDEEETNKHEDGQEVTDHHHQQKDAKHFEQASQKNHLYSEQQQQQQQQEQYSHEFQEASQSLNNSPNKLDFHSPPAQNLPKPIATNKPITTAKPIINDANMFKNVFNHYDSQDEPSHQQERHSVLGIHNQFQDDDEEDEEQEDIVQQKSSVSKNYGSSVTFGQQHSQGLSQVILQQSVNKTSQPPQNSSNQANIFSNPSQQKPQAQLISTGYKMTQKQAHKNPNQAQQQKKQFSSSSSQANFYQQPSKKISKPSKPSKPQKGSKQQTQEQDQNQYFINPTIKKYKSDAKLQKTIGSGSKKSTTKKNLYKYTSPMAKQSRKLVSHPTIKKQYRKAVNPEAKKLTQQVKTQASMILKKKKQSILVSSIVNPAESQMERKAKELKVKLADWKKESKMHEKRKLKTSTNHTRSDMELAKVLNWRQGQLKKQKQQFQKAMEMKLQVQKQAYIKKINSLLIKLQKQKQLHQRQQYKQQLLQQNQQAAKRLTAIEQWYKDRISMLKDNSKSNRNQRQLMHTGHKEILKHIQKELKRQNQKQIMAITMKYRKQQAQVENDLEQLEKEIIKVYKSH